MSFYQIAQSNPQNVQLEVIGHSLQGREIIALKVTHGAGMPDGSRPAVLYSAAQHAREWISVEVNRRLLHYFVDNYGVDPDVTDLVNTRELWFVPVANPDGYQYTFDIERLWRKNLRDNNGDGQITIGDGVDPNRNFDEHWNYDNEGSIHTDLKRHLPRLRTPPLNRRHKPCRGCSTGSIQVHGQLPLVRPAAALLLRLAGADAIRRWSNLSGAVRDGRQPGYPGL